MISMSILADMFLNNSGKREKNIDKREELNKSCIKKAQFQALIVAYCPNRHTVQSRGSNNVSA